MGGTVFENTFSPHIPTTSGYGMMLTGMDCFNTDVLFPRTPGLYQWIYHSILTHGDPYFHLADFELYLKAQEKAAADFKKPQVWARKAILNVARIGKFSSDRTIREYARDIWEIRSCE